MWQCGKKNLLNCASSLSLKARAVRKIYCTVLPHSPPKAMGPASLCTWNPLWTSDWQGPVHNAFDAGKSITWARGRGLGSVNQDFFRRHGTRSSTESYQKFMHPLFLEKWQFVFFFVESCGLSWLSAGSRWGGGRWKWQPGTKSSTGSLQKFMPSLFLETWRFVFP